MTRSELLVSSRAVYTFKGEPMDSTNTRSDPRTYIRALAGAVSAAITGTLLYYGANELLVSLWVGVAMAGFGVAEAYYDHRISA